MRVPCLAIDFCDSCQSYQVGVLIGKQRRWRTNGGGKGGVDIGGSNNSNGNTTALATINVEVAVAKDSNTNI